ncbi:unnamed protein product [Linum trigynum]|uniref:Uncharacterized protein n=1 Tax=Linum trigynum TaxID=586398 RepID=A0AAV2DUC0_9ROSI
MKAVDREELDGMPSRRSAETVGEVRARLGDLAAKGRRLRSGWQGGGIHWPTRICVGLCFVVAMISLFFFLFFFLSFLPSEEAW